MSITPDTLKNHNIITPFITEYKCYYDDKSPVVIYYELLLINETTVDMHTHEKILFENIFRTFQTIYSSEQWYNNKNDYPNNVIAFDFYELDENIIKAIHTASIWKKKDDEYIIIDPNNINFSARIINILNSHFHHYGKFNIIYSKNPDIYKSNSKNKRDCTDLAIKNGFILNELHITYQMEELETNLINLTTNNKNNISKDTKHKDNYKIFNETIYKEQHSTNKLKRDEFLSFIENKDLQKYYCNIGLKNLQHSSIYDTYVHLIEIEKCISTLNNNLKTNYNFVLK